MDNGQIMIFKNSLNMLKLSTVTINQNDNIILIHKYKSLISESNISIRMYINTPGTGYRYTIKYIREFYLKLKELGMLEKVKDELRMTLLSQM